MGEIVFWLTFPVEFQFNASVPVRAARQPNSRWTEAACRLVVIYRTCRATFMPQLAWARTNPS